MKDTKKLLGDMLKAIISIKSYQLKSMEEFESDLKTQDAVMYNLIVLGEAANSIEPSFIDNHPEIPWSSIIGTRNVIVHGYDQIKLPIVWDIVSRDIPLLEDKLLRLQ